MKDEEISLVYDNIKTSAQNALEAASDRRARADRIEEIVGLVFVMLAAFVGMLLILFLVSFLGVAHFKIELERIFLWSAFFAVVCGVIEICGLVWKHKQKDS